MGVVLDLSAKLIDKWCNEYLEILNTTQFIDDANKWARECIPGPLYGPFVVEMRLRLKQRGIIN